MGLFKKGKICIIAQFHRTDLVILCSDSREGKVQSYSQINMVKVHVYQCSRLEGII